ncbi:hypothetical protein ACIPW4_11400 [Pseudomonas sp. NPDC089996]|uniref:hypothetical protein n=1 Tax=Pseudomonas sp. NPDC089996 TaxID=3364474 RepID=UPI003829B112
MSTDDRALFESKLLKELKLVAAKFDGVTASKNKLKFKHKKEFVAELVLEHLSRVDSYVLIGMVHGGEIFECSAGFNPPYKSNLFNKSCFSFTSAGEQHKVFSDSPGGAIKTPTPDSVDQVCAHIRGALENFYIPKILACIVPNDRTIKDVLSSPEDYAYPAIFIHCTAILRKGGELFDLDEAKKSKKIIKNKEYDMPLLSSLN